MPDESDSNRREYFRIDDVLYMRAHRLSEAELAVRRQQTSMSSRLSGMLHSMLPKQSESKHGDQTNELVGAIEALDAKLNYLIGINMLNEAEAQQLEETEVNLSGMGMSFFSELPQKAGDHLQIILVVPMVPSQIMDLLAEVKWVRQEGGRQRVGAHFHFRNAEERDSVARYVFKRHREMIRVQE